MGKVVAKYLWAAAVWEAPLVTDPPLAYSTTRQNSPICYQPICTAATFELIGYFMGSGCTHKGFFKHHLTIWKSVQRPHFSPKLFFLTQFNFFFYFCPTDIEYTLSLRTSWSLDNKSWQIGDLNNYISHGFGWSLDFNSLMTWCWSILAVQRTFQNKLLVSRWGQTLVHWLPSNIIFTKTLRLKCQFENLGKYT